VTKTAEHILASSLERKLEFSTMLKEKGLTADSLAVLSNKPISQQGEAVIEQWLGGEVVQLDILRALVKKHKKTK
jgi:hypothetical protein